MRKFLWVFIFSVFASNVLATGAWQSCNGVGPIGSAASVCQDLVKNAGESYEFSHTEAQDESTVACYAKYKGGSGSPDLVGSACKTDAGIAGEREGTPEEGEGNPTASSSDDPTEEEKNDETALAQKEQSGEEQIGEEQKSSPSASDVPAEEEKNNETASAQKEQSGEKKKSPPKNCNYEFRQSKVAQGEDLLSNLLCETASNNSPSFRVYPIKEDKSVAKQLTEIDALRGNIWYECKCGYLSTVKDVLAGKENALIRFTGPDGIDKKIRTQVQVAKECGYEYNLVVASKTVEEYFRGRYADVKVVRENFEPCEQ